MSKIEISSGLETVITPCFHFHFHWMGDHWKQHIVSVGGCEAIPKIWSIEGLISHDTSLRQASPAFQRLSIKQDTTGLTVASLHGRSGPHHYSGTFSFEEREEEVAIDVDVNETCTESSQLLSATYLIESSGGHLHLDGENAVTITWSNPETQLRFEAEPPFRVHAQEAGMGTIRLIALSEPDSTEQDRTLRYRWRWIATPGHQLWDREV
jgi:hypothetical protein